ncbi:N-acetyltransferase [Desulfothermus okinawensis JCM 13304]
MDKLILRKAIIHDVEGIYNLLLDFGNQGKLLPRSLSNLYSNVRDFFVVVNQEGKVYGCGALAIIWRDLAEVRSVAVHSEIQKNGWGKRIVEACLSEALTLGIYRVFVLTYEESFFAKLGFEEVDKKKLHEKIWVDCFNCPKYPNNCDEIAMIINL